MDIRHVLIVDDAPLAASLLARMIEHSNGGSNCHVSIAHSGEEAMAVLTRCSVDLLVTDQRMPGVTGLELIRWAREFSPLTPTVLITGSGNHDVKRAAQNLDADYLTKPCAPEQFIRTVQTALHPSPGGLTPADQRTAQQNQAR